MKAKALWWLTRPLVPAALAWVAGLLALFFGFNSFLMPWVAGKFAPTAQVPRLLDLKPEEAEKAVREQKLVLMLDSVSDFSPNIPAGRIQFQFPEAGTQVKPNRRVWVRVSKGLRGVEVPVLRGMSQRQAEISLQQAGLGLGQARMVRSETVPAGAVIGSRPRAGIQVQTGRAVDLEISSGVEDAVTQMPSFVGLSLAKAKRQIEGLRLKLGFRLRQAQPENLTANGAGAESARRRSDERRTD